MNSDERNADRSLDDDDDDPRIISGSKGTLRSVKPPLRRLSMQVSSLEALQTNTAFT